MGVNGASAGPASSTETAASRHPAMTDSRTVLLVHHRDVRSPFSATVPHYLLRELSERHTVHVLCRDRPDVENDDRVPASAVEHCLYTGRIRLVSGPLFLLLSTVYAGLLGFRVGFDATYGFQRTIPQAWVASRSGNARFVVGLQSVPVRQEVDLLRTSSADRDLGKRLSVGIQSLYAVVVGRLLQRATAVVCLTDGIRRITEREYGIDLSDAHVIGMGVDPDVFAAADGRNRSPRFTEPVTVTYVGTMGESRGLEHVVEALAATERDVRFRVVGDGVPEYIDAVKATAERLGVADRVEWAGRIPHEAVPAVLAESDIAVSPLDDIESFRISFPAKLLEYLAAGVVVVATDIPPHRDLIDDGRNGLLYDGTAAGFRDALARCFENPGDKRRLERAARETARDYDWADVVERHERVLFGRPADGPAATELVASRR